MFQTYRGKFFEYHPSARRFFDIRDLSIPTLRGSIGYVPQDVFLFSDTIRNNIAFGSNFLEESKIMKAAKDADLYDNIIDFPDHSD